MKNSLLLAAIPMLLFSACTQQSTAQRPANQQNDDAAFKKIHDEYVVEFLRRNPTVNTYLGGAGLDPKLREVDGTSARSFCRCVAGRRSLARQHKEVA